VRKLNRSAEVHTVPLGLDIMRYPFEVSAKDSPIVSLIGSFDWRPSYSAGKRLIERLWPAIRQRVPGAQLLIVGRRALEFFGDHANAPGVSIHQDVPETLPYFREASVLVYAPERGSGMKVKVLEAFALGLPVVTTDEGVEGIPAMDGVHAGVANDDRGLIDRTVRLLESRHSRECQARAARALVEQHCNPGVTLDAVERLYTRLLERQRAAV
jgi:glycosyltransferase involved in cell wall biosynthesis